MNEFGKGPIPDPNIGEEAAQRRSALRESAKAKPLEEMSDEEVLAVFNPQGIGWDVIPNIDNDPKIAAQNREASKIRERLDQITRRKIQQSKKTE